MNRPASDPRSPAQRLSIDDVPAIVRPLLATAREGGDLKAAVGTAVRTLGFNAFVFARSHRNGSTGRDGLAVWGLYDERWERIYRERNYRAVDPRWEAAAASATPIVWDRSTFPDSPARREFFAAAAEFGVRSGVMLPLSQQRPNGLEVFLVSSTVDLPDRARRDEIAHAMGDLWAIGAYGFQLLGPQLLAGGDNGTRARPLTPRELECLALAARGATSRAIAEHLDISERTVNSHIERAIRKCGARNRHQAIARAISDGSIAL